MATYTNAVFVLNGSAPYGPITLANADNLTLNLAAVSITTSASLGLGTSGVMTTVNGPLTVDEDATFNGNVNILGTVTSISSQEVLVSDNHIVLNSGYTAGVAQTGGLVVNSLPEATVDTAAAGGFTAGVMGVSNPTLATVGAATFSTGDIIQIDGANNPANNGIFEVLTQAANVLEIRGVGVTGTVEDFTQTQFVTDTTVAGNVTLINVAVIRAGTDGAWEVAYGKTTGLVFTDLSTGGGGGAGTDNLTWTVNQDNVGADEDGALYLDSGDGTNARQGRLTMAYPNSAGNGLTFSYDSAPAATDYGFGFYFTPTNGGAASGATAGGQGGQFYFAGGSGGAAGAGAGVPGVGGPITLRGGTGGMGGAGSTSGAIGGSVTISGGVGGMAAGGTAGYGGELTLSGGLGASGSGNGASLSLVGGGGGNLGAATLTAKNIDIGATAVARAVNIATGAAAQTVIIGSQNTTSSLTLDSGTGVIDIGTGAQARTITIGNAAATAVNLNAIAMTFTTVDALALTDGTATFQLGGTGAATLSGGTSTTIDGSGVIELNSTGAAISIGNDADAFGINIGTGAAARTITIGNGTGATSLVLNAGTGNIDIGANAFARTTNLATGAAAQTLTIGSTNTTSSTTINAGSGGITLGAPIVGMSANAAENVSAGDVVYLTSSSTFGLADADASGKKIVFGIALNTDTTGNPIKVATTPGQILTVNTDLSAATVGVPVYADKTTAGGLVVAAPTGGGTVVYQVGFVHTAAVAGTAKIMYMPQFITAIA